MENLGTEKKLNLINETLNDGLIKDLCEEIDCLSKNLQIQVLGKHKDLLRQANHSNKLENVLNIMFEHVQNLSANVERVKSQIETPHKKFENDTRILGRLQESTNILRQLNRLHYLNKKLSNSNDPLQKAPILQELDSLASNPNLKNIEIVTVELRKIRIKKQQVFDCALEVLHSGIQYENLKQITIALEIFLKLGVIENTLQDLIEEKLVEIEKILLTFFAQRSKTPVWGDLETIFEDIFQICKKMKLFQISVENFGFSFNFWVKLSEILQNKFEKAPLEIQRIFEQDFPKLLKIINDIHEKLDIKIGNKFMLKFENAFLVNLQTKMTNTTKTIFNKKDETITPSHDEIDQLIRQITNFLSLCLFDEHLTKRICENIAKSLQIFATKIEQKLEKTTESTQVIGGHLNKSQQQNIKLANSLYYLQNQMQRVFSNMKDGLRENNLKIINVDFLTNLQTQIVAPLIASINVIMETIIVTIHSESDWDRIQVNSNKIPHNFCSPYMRELTQFLHRVFNIYLTPFDNKELVFFKCKEIAIRCIDLLIRHASFLSPLSEGGRVRLGADFHHLEVVLKATICPELPTLGRPYRLLKSIGPLISKGPREMAAAVSSSSQSGVLEVEEGHKKGALINSVVPPSTVLWLMFAYSSTPELEAPHKNASWNPVEMSKWLDRHPLEIDRLNLIGGALQRYETLVRQKNDLNYDQVYPVISNFLKLAIEELN